MLTPIESRAHLILRFAIVALGATLMVVSFAAAASTGAAQASGAAGEKVPAATASSDPAAGSDAPGVTARIMVALKPLTPEGMRLTAVTLGCKPPANAVLKSVAPGIERLQSRAVIVEFSAGDRSFACEATIEAQRRVLVAAHDIAPDRPVTDEDFTSRWLDAFTGAPGAAAIFPEPGPYNSSTLIRAGQPLYVNELARPIAVHAGDLVTVVVKNGPVTVHTQLRAQSQAAIGETAAMINPLSGSPIMVTVTGIRTAELMMQ